MSGKDKRIQEILSNPKAVDFETLDLTLKDFGYTCKKGKGSHFKYMKPGVDPIVVPYNRPYVKVYYVKLVIEILGLQQGG